MGEKLVKMGLARAYGVWRNTPAGLSSNEYREWLRDMEFRSAKMGVGIWAATDWKSLPIERRTERKEEAELKLATAKQLPDSGFRIDPNTAARDELMKLPGIGEVLANRIIESRPYESLDELYDVEGIG